MWEQIQSFLKSLAGGEETERFETNDPRVAVAALCIQVIQVLRCILAIVFGIACT